MDWGKVYQQLAILGDRITAACISSTLTVIIQFQDLGINRYVYIFRDGTVAHGQ